MTKTVAIHQLGYSKIHDIISWVKFIYAKKQLAKMWSIAENPTGFLCLILHNSVNFIHSFLVLKIKLIVKQDYR